MPDISERFGLMLEAYLHGAGSYCDQLRSQTELLNSLNVCLIVAWRTVSGE